MSTVQSFPFVHYAHAGNKTLTESHCSLCGMLIAASPQKKYLAVAEAAHKCPMTEGRQ